MTDPWHAMGPFPGRILPPEYEDKPAPISVGFVDTTAADRAPNPVTSKIKQAQAQPDVIQVKVRVNKPYRVVRNGKAYTGGNMLSVPSDVATVWTKNKWVTRVTPRKDNNNGV